MGNQIFSCKYIYIYIMNKINDETEQIGAINLLYCQRHAVTSLRRFQATTHKIAAGHETHKKYL